MLILNSRGLNTKTGSEQIKGKLDELGFSDLSGKTIFIVIPPDYDVNDLITDNCVRILGLKEENIKYSGYEVPDENFNPDFIYVTEGNTYEILRYMRLYALDTFIKKWYSDNSGAVYIGSSAGAIIAGTDIESVGHRDRNWVQLREFDSLGLFDGTIFPHTDDEMYKDYLSDMGEELRARYKNIYHVSNFEIMVIDECMQ